MPAETWPLDSAGPDATRALGAALGRLLAPGDVVALIGELGSGKTVLVQGVASGLGCPPEIVHSPTFTLVNEYPCNGRGLLAHFDLYRIRSDDELPGIGWDAYVGRAIVIIEWAERAMAFLPGDHLRVELTPTAPTRRRFAVQANGPRAAALLHAWGSEVSGRR